MAGEDARVEVRIDAEDNLFWVANAVNGYDSGSSIRAASIEDAEKIAPEVERLIKTVYRKAYRDGYSSCQRAIKDALGIPLPR
jgi:hypothetical protein